MNDPLAPPPDQDAVLDPERLLEIAELDLFDPELGEILDDLAREAAEQYGLPISMVNVILDEAQYIAAHHGVDGWVGEAQGIPVEWAFCRFTVRDHEAFVIENMLEHERAEGNPLVENDGIRCYAGVPLVTSRGHAIGSFCVVGAEARSFSEEDLEGLRGFAKEAMRRIEARRLPQAA